MVDTLWFHAPLIEVKVDPKADLGVTPVPVNLRTGEMKTKHGSEYGFRVGDLHVGGLYANTEHYSVDVSTRGAVVKVYSLPRLVHRSKGAIDPVTADEAEEGINRMWMELADRGVEFPSSVKVCRADLFRNLETKYPPSVYAGMLRSIGGMRTEQRAIGDSVLFRNSQREVSFYNKVDQARDVHGVDLSERGNLMRLEFRALRGAVVRRDIEVSNTEDLLRSWDILPRLYAKQVRRIVFSRVEHEAELATLHGKLSAYKQRLIGSGRKEWLHQAVYLIGLERVASLTKQERRDLFESLANKQAYHRIEREIREADVFRSLSDRELYQELSSLVG